MTAALLAALAAAASAAGAPQELPPPLPPPFVASTPAPDDAPSPGDLLELLWGHRLALPGGEPAVSIRVAEQRDEILLATRVPSTLEVRGRAPVRVSAGVPLRARVVGGSPARVVWSPLLATFDANDREGLLRARELWESRGVRTRTLSTGGVYGIGGRVVDNRRALLVAGGAWTEASAADFGARAWRLWGERPEPTAEVESRPSGTVEVLGPRGEVLARGDRLVVLDGQGGGASVDGRDQRGRVALTVDATGRLAAVLVVPLEELLRGLVPSEMPAGSPPEALRAQAVTARSNVLAQVGTRHLGDPWSICSDVHCQAYRGESAHVPSTDAAVRSTRGEVLLDAATGRLVDGVYSAMCGGHGEDNEAVWGGTPSPNLRGRPDLSPADAAPWAGGLATEERVAAFLAAAPAGCWCARAPGARPGRFRWERAIPQAEADRLLAPLGLGAVDGLVVTHRGSSGRAVSIRVDGERGSATLHGELRIRRLLGDLPSAMFVVAATQDGWLLRGGGWGHGVGMCQWGAIGRAAAGQDHRRILGAYFTGAEVARAYQ